MVSRGFGVGENKRRKKGNVRFGGCLEFLSKVDDGLLRQFYVYFCTASMIRFKSWFEFSVFNQEYAAVLNVQANVQEKSK